VGLRRNYFVFDFVVSLEGLEVDDEDGVLLEPAPAEPLVELDGELDDEAPPLAGLFVVSLPEELELEGELDGEELIEDEELPEPEGEVLGEVELLPDEDALPDGEVLGEVVEPEGAVLVDEPLGPLERLQPVTAAVPSATVMANAKVESLMRPPW
jgi:hypothetical protein